jgi:hypothetical protein
MATRVRGEDQQVDVEDLAAVCRRGLVGRVRGFGFGCVVEELVAFAGGADGRELDIADGGDSLRGAIVEGQELIELLRR